MAPDGTTTLSELAEAMVILAFAAPKKTVLAETDVLKLVPEMMTVLPDDPDAGEMEVTTGVCAKHCKPILNNRQLHI